MPERDSENISFDYAVIRVVPRVERQEFMNVGVIVYSSTQAWLQARIEVDCARLGAFAPHLDVDAAQEYLGTIPLICEGGENSGPVGALPQRARFHWLVAPRSTIIQTSPVHSGTCHNLEAALEQLLNKLVRLPPDTA